MKPTRLLTFGAVGCLCLGLQYMVLRGLTGIHWPTVWADGVAFTLSAQLNFWLSYQYTWRDTPRVYGRKLVRKWLMFNGVVVLSAGVNAAVYSQTHHLLATAPALVVAGIASAITSFALNHLVVLRPLEARREVA